MGKIEEERDETYRAIGRYIVEFSALVFWMRWMVEAHLIRQGNLSEKTVPVLINILSPAAADTITEAFFAACMSIGELDEAETQVATGLKNRVRKEQKRRNDYAHGDWRVNSGDGAVIFGESPSLLRPKLGMKSLDDLTETEISATEIDQVSDSLSGLRQWVIEFGQMCLDPDLMQELWKKEVRVRDVFRVDKRKVVKRDGPLANERQPWFQP